MKEKFTIKQKHSVFTFFTALFFSMSLVAQNEFTEFSGKVIDGRSNETVEAASLNINETNISTVTNSEGEFKLKVPNKFLDSKVIVSTLGYATRVLPLSELARNGNEIRIYEAITELSAVSISAYKNAEGLVKKVFNEKTKNLQNESVYMTAFYRETIKRRNRNVSLTEAVVNILKQPYSSYQHDDIKLDKARKSTDYKRLDTLTLKLQGGPFSAIYLDVMKYPEYIFTDETISSYDWSFDQPTTVNGKNVYVVNFKPRMSNLSYVGKLFIDVQSLALVSADYSLDVSNRKKARNLLVKKKPKNVIVYPQEVSYKVDYKEKDGKWYYSYSNLNLEFKVNKKREWFNKVYTLSSEMAVTDWQINTTDIKIKSEDQLKPTVIITDAISGFSDPDFWGEYNLIEPDKSIQSAIDKIKKNIEKRQDDQETESGKP